LALRNGPVGPYLEVLRMIRRLFRILGKTEVLKGFLVDLKWKGMECSSSFGYLGFWVKLKF